MTATITPTMDMPKNVRHVKIDLDDIYNRKVEPHLRSMPWVLRVTDHKKRPSPVLVIKYRKPRDEDENSTQLVERGDIYGDSLRRCLPSIRTILSRVRDENDVHLDLHQFVSGKQITFRGNLPLDENVEIMSVRINNFTAEEASYWLSRILHFSDASNRWAAAGMRIMLGGQSGDPAIAEMLKQIDHKE